jgi:thiol-disulfide isomerase/thioredoxin
MIRHKNGVQRKSLEDGQLLASRYDGYCLEAKEFTREKWKWMCKYGHVWETTYKIISSKKKSWCPKCYFTQIDDLKKIAKDRGGECLSEVYKNNREKLKWKCYLGHEFDMSLNNVKYQGSWCPYCKSFNSEEICRKHFESIFNCKFNKVRPDWLRNKNGNKLELDGLSDKIFDGYHIAFEHQGGQHYFENYMFDIDLKKLQEHDNIKIELCKNNNVHLFQIPHLIRILKLDDLYNFVKNKCIDFNINLNDLNFDKNIDYNDIYYLSKYYDLCKDIIESKNGTLISEHYFGSLETIVVKCKNGHEFKTNYHKLKYNSWCKLCRLKKGSNETFNINTSIK